VLIVTSLGWVGTHTVAVIFDRRAPDYHASLNQRLPNSKLVILEAGHFVWEVAAGGYASLIADWAADDDPGTHRSMEV
jgi:pimeloyl-ACP methyl ester carboxylesterase